MFIIFHTVGHCDDPPWMQKS